MVKRHIGFGVKSILVGVGALSLLFYFPNLASAEVIHPVLDVVYLTNQERAKNNLAPLALNARLTAAAHQKARDMLAQGYFDHTSPDGREPWDFISAADYPYTFAGENLAINFINPLTTFQAWMNSPSHRDNILFPQYQEIGVATHSAEFKGKMTTVTVQLFGSREDFTPYASYLGDSQSMPQKTEAFMDASTTDNKGLTGYVASSISINRNRSNSQVSQPSPLFLWVMLGIYLVLVVGLLCFFTQKRLFYSFVKRTAVFFWSIAIFILLI
ncbi:MAG: CAP domain-containing protein [Patescibacteria group bacterium]|nr:CAP domain-containing protein [Patescibacteria group bacterium]